MQFEYDVKGNLAQRKARVPGVNVFQIFAHDSEGRLSSATLNGRAATLGYDLNSRLTSIAYPAGFTAGYTYDGDGRVTAIKKDTTTLASYTYDSAGRLAARTLANGVVTAWTYTLTGQVNSITVVKAGSTLWSVLYGYDALDNRLWAQYGGFLNGKGHAYKYNGRQELVAAKYGATNPYATEETSGYDAAGNRVAFKQNSVASTWAVNDLNQYTGITNSGFAAPTYNTRGDVSAFNGRNFQYDAAGHLIRVSGGSGGTVQYLYDGLGDRVGNVIGTTTKTSLLLSSHPLEVYNGTSTETVSYIYEPGIDRPLALYKSSDGSLTYFHQDALGSVVALSNASGAITEEYSYDAWGAFSVIKNGSIQPSTTVPASPFLFTGREYDAETGLYHYRARAYSTKLGRFLQIDPINFGGGDLNIYRYVKNNSVVQIDPFGLSCSWPWSNWDWFPPIGLFHGIYEIGAWPTEGILSAIDTYRLALDTGNERINELEQMVDGNRPPVTTLGGDAVNQNLPEIANGIANIISDVPGTSFNYPASLMSPAEIGGTVIQNAATGGAYDQVTSSTPSH